MKRDRIVRGNKTTSNDKFKNYVSNFFEIIDTLQYILTLNFICFSIYLFILFIIIFVFRLILVV